MMLYALADKNGFTPEQIKKVSGDFNDVAESLSRNYITWKDISTVLSEEYGVSVDFIG